MELASVLIGNNINIGKLQELSQFDQAKKKELKKQIEER